MQTAEQQSAIIAQKHPNKRINIISKRVEDETGKVIQEEGILMRTTRSYAARLIAQGTHTYTSKSKLKSFLNKEGKLHRNERTLHRLGIDLTKLGKKGKDVSRTEQKSFIYNDQYTGKVYLALWLKDVDVTLISKKEIDHKTGKPLEKLVQEGRYQLLILKFPN